MHLKLKPVAFLLPLVLWALAQRLAWFRRWIAGSGVKRAYAAVCGVMIALPVVLGVCAIVTERMTMAYANTILAIGANYLHGQPMFSALHGPTEYGLVYGPVTYLVYVPVMLLGGVREWTFEVWVVLALAMAAVLLWFAMRRSHGRYASLTAVALLMLFAGQNMNNLWLPGPDIWLVAFSALGVWGSQRKNRYLAVLVVALAGAAMVDIKVSTLIAASLPCLLLAERAERVDDQDSIRRWSLAVGSFVLLLVLTGSVYLLPRVSLRNNLAILSAETRVGLLVSTLKINVGFALPLLLPMALLLWIGRVYAGEALHAWWVKRRIFLAGLALAILAAIVTGAKVGSGPWHLLPFVAALGFATGELAELVWNEEWSTVLLSRTAGALCVATMAMLAVSALHDLGVHTRKVLEPAAGSSMVPPRLAEREVMQIMQEHPHTVLQMGVSDLEHYDLTLVSPVLQIGGSPLLMDPNARADADSEGAGESDALLDTLRSCKIGLWLIPKGGEPFSKLSAYYIQAGVGERMLYPENFRQAFFTSYRLMDSHYQYYDLWGCRNRR